MSASSSLIEVKPELIEFMKELEQSSRELLLISIATSDGFNIKTFAAKSLKLESDKLAAMASSICALSASSANHLTKGKLDATTLETSHGNVLFKKTAYLNNDCVVTIAAKPKLSLGQARFILQRFTEKVQSL